MVPPPQHDPIAQIVTILDCWCWVGVVVRQYAPDMLPGGRPFGPYRFDVTVKPDLERMSDGTSASLVRAVYMERAEQMLDALEAAGWHLTAYPEMRFTGEVEPFAVFLDGALGTPSIQHGISLAMKIEVNGPALPEVRHVEIRRRSPQEARERILSSALPSELAEALADELAMEPVQPESSDEG